MNITNEIVEMDNEDEDENLVDMKVIFQFYQNILMVLLI